MVILKNFDKQSNITEGFKKLNRTKTNQNTQKTTNQSRIKQTTISCNNGTTNDSKWNIGSYTSFKSCHTQIFIMCETSKTYFSKYTEWI